MVSRGPPRAMRRPVFLLVVVLAALLASPLAHGRYVFQGKSPWDSGYPLNPQMYCAVLYDEAGQQDCTVTGNVRGAEVVRIRIVGTARVEVTIVDMKGPVHELPEQRAIVECTQTCLVPIPGSPFTDPDWVMRTYTSSPGVSFVEASVESGAQLTEDQEI